MTAFRYAAAESDGTVVTGTILASTSREATGVLNRLGLMALHLEASAPHWRARRFKPGDLAPIFRGLAALTEAGVPLARALSTVAGLTRRPELRLAIEEAGSLLQKGQSFSSALGQATPGFPRSVLGVLKAGESGSLGPALERVAHQLEDEAELRGRLRQALAYPAFLLIVGSVSLVIVSTAVLPRFAALLADLGQTLPPTTRVLLSVTTYASAHLLGLGTILVGGVAAIMGWIETSTGKAALHAQLLRLPLIGGIRHDLASARFARALGALLDGGAPLLPAMDMATESVTDIEIASRMSAAGKMVSEGNTLTKSLGTHRVVSPSALQLIAIGEESGRLAEFLLKGGDLAATEAQRSLRTLVGLAEPLLVVLFGGAVAFLAAALLQAVYSLRPGG